MKPNPETELREAIRLLAECIGYGDPGAGLFWFGFEAGIATDHDEQERLSEKAHDLSARVSDFLRRSL